MRRLTGTALLAAVAVSGLLWANASAQTSRGAYGNTEAITLDELKSYDYFLSADQLEGRNVPSRGYDTAALYIASHLREWGVKPGGSATGTDGPLQPYLMPIELTTSAIDAENMKLTLTAPAAGGRGGRGGAAAAPATPAPPVTRGFEYAREWTVGAGGGFGGGRGGGGATVPADIQSAALLFVGNGYVINKTNVNPYQGLDVKGKILVVAGVPPELAAAQAAAAAGRAGGGAGAPAGGRGRGAAPNPLGVENTDFVTPQTYAARNGALGIIMVPTFQQLTTMANPAPAGRGSLNGPSYQVVKFQANRPPSVPTITAGVALTGALFQGERLSATQIFEGATANAKLDSFAFSAEKKLSEKIAVTTDQGHTENVVGIIEGGDPVLKNQYVVTSAHLDHVGFSASGAGGDNIANGADDDASGSAAMMAMARVYAQGAARGIRPKRTLIFLWVTGEEKGLWGSQYFNQFPPIDITKVVANLNMDMIGRTKTPGYVDPPQYKLCEPGEIFVVGPNISSDDLNKTLETVNNGYQKLKLNHFYDVTTPDATHDNLGPQPNGQRIFSRSDHYNFAKMGIPVVFLTTGIHSDYHRVTDSADKIDFTEMLKVTKTVSALAWTLANTATPPKLNAKLPDQLVNDMKTVKDQGWGKLTPVPPPFAGIPK
jgi:Zn-dependent M28 family amino/carboxypeptidase